MLSVMDWPPHNPDPNITEAVWDHQTENKYIMPNRNNSWLKVLHNVRFRPYNTAEMPPTTMSNKEEDSGRTSLREQQPSKDSHTK